MAIATGIGGDWQREVASGTGTEGGAALAVASDAQALPLPFGFFTSRFFFALFFVSPGHSFAGFDSE